MQAGGSSEETLNAQRVVKISNSPPGPPPAVVPHLLHLHDRPMLDAHSRGKSAPLWKTFVFRQSMPLHVLGAVRTGDAAAATQLFAGAAAAGPRATDHPYRKDHHRRDGPNHSVEDAADARPGRHPCVRSRGAAGRGGEGRGEVWAVYDGSASPSTARRTRSRSLHRDPSRTSGSSLEHWDSSGLVVTFLSVPKLWFGSGQSRAQRQRHGRRGKGRRKGGHEGVRVSPPPPLPHLPTPPFPGTGGAGAGPRARTAEKVVAGGGGKEPDQG